MTTRLNLRLCPLNAALVLAGLFAMPGIAQATDATGPGDWNTPATWFSGVPNSTTDARIPNTGPVTLGAPGAAQALELQGGGEVIVTTGGALVVGGIINVGTTAGGPARLRIELGGAVSARNLFVGDAPQLGIVTVTGAGSTLTLAPIGVGQADRAEIGGNGAGELHIDDGANVTLNGTRTLHVGDTANGTLAIGSGAGAGTLTADSVILGTTGSSVQFNHTGTTTFTAAISGNGSLTKTGAGTTILTGASSYTGGTALNGGGITVGNNTALGTGRLTVGSASSLATNTIVTLGNAVTLNANLTVDGSNVLALNGNITGGSGLIKNGASTLTLRGANDFSGGVALNAGMLMLGSNSALGTGALSAAANTTLDATTAVTANNDVSLAGNLNIGGSANLTLAGVVSGAGRLTKGGSANLTLGNANTFIGGVSLNSGSLTVGNATALGADVLTVGGSSTLDSSTAVTLANNVILNANLAAGGANALALGGDITGAGGLTKVGTGTLTLTGTNLYTGGTTVSAGTLQGNTTSLQNAITNNATVVFDQAANGNYAGNMGGTGSLTKTNNGTLILTGTNSYSGGTSINLGTLQGNTDSLQGAIHNGTAVVFDQATAGTYTGAMDGLGSFSKTGAGTLTLSGANTFSGGTTVSAGMLQGNTTSLQGAITNNAAVTFDQATGGTYAGAMGGTGTFTKLGAGNLILTGTSTYNGTTTVNAGTLSVNGSVSNSAVTVNNGGTLGGSGTVGSTTIATGGVLAPGNSIGTLTVNGNVTFAAGSTYRVEVDAAGANDRINATGTATINGGTVDVQAGAGTYQASTQYTILNAAGGRTGNFAGVTSNLAFLTPTLGYDANNVFLTLARNDISFASVAITPNQIAASTALQNAGNASDMGVVQTALTGLSAVQARAAYDASGGAGIVELRRASGGFAASFGNRLQARLGALQTRGEGTLANSFSDRPILLAANDTLSDLMAPVSDAPSQKFSLAGNAPALPAASDAGRGLWVRGFGGNGHTDGDGNAAASRLRSAGLSIGFDAEVQDGLRVGAAVTAGTSRLNTDNNESGKTRGSALAVYGSYATGPWNFSGSASLGWGKNHMDRSIAVGALNRVAASDFDSNTLSAYGEASYAIAMNGWTLQPLAGLSLSRNKADGFTETGAGALNLQVAEQTINSSKVMLGAKASFDAGRIRFEPRVIWAHEFGDLNTPMTAQFQGAATASPFQISGATLKRDTLILGLGAAGSISKGIDLFADVQAEFNAAQRNVALLVGLRSRW